MVAGPKFQLNFDFSDQICPERVFPLGNGKIALVRASMVVTSYIKLFRTGANRHNGILMSLFLLVAETISFSKVAGCGGVRIWSSYKLLP